MDIMLCHVLVLNIDIELFVILWWMHVIVLGSLWVKRLIYIGLFGGNDKPLGTADMLLCSWDEGLDVFMDFTESSPWRDLGCPTLCLVVL